MVWQVTLCTKNKLDDDTMNTFRMHMDFGHVIESQKTEYLRLVCEMQSISPKVEQNKLSRSGTWQYKAHHNRLSIS